MGDVGKTRKVERVVPRELPRTPQRQPQRPAGKPIHVPNWPKPKVPASVPSRTR